MRISDWSSDVCSSDLPVEAGHQRDPVRPYRLTLGRCRAREHPFAVIVVRRRDALGPFHQEKGRAKRRGVGFEGDRCRYRQVRPRRERLDYPILAPYRWVLIHLMPARLAPQHPFFPPPTLAAARVAPDRTNVL